MVMGHRFFFLDATKRYCILTRSIVFYSLLKYNFNYQTSTDRTKRTGFISRSKNSVSGSILIKELKNEEKIFN